MNQPDNELQSGVRGGHTGCVLLSGCAGASASCLVLRGVGAGFPPCKLCDILAEKEFCFKASTTLEEGLKKTYQWFLDNIK